MDAVDRLIKIWHDSVVEFGQQLEDFINGLPAERARFWNIDLWLWLQDQRARGLKVDGASYQRLRAVLDKRRDALLAQGVRMMPAYVPSAEQKAREQASIRARNDRPQPPAALPRGPAFALAPTAPAESPAPSPAPTPTSPLPNDVVAPQDQLALAPEEEQQPAQPDDTAPKAGGISGPIDGLDDGSDLPWVNFDSYMENEGTLYYEVAFQWWKVPVKKIKYQGEEVYDVRGAVKFNPTFVQSMLLSHKGWLDDTGWDIVVAHYRDQYGPEGHEQLLKDLSSLGIGHTFVKYTLAQGPQMFMALLFGEAATRLAKIASPALRKTYAEFKKRLDVLTRRSKKESKQVLEKELQKFVDDLRGAAERETDKAAQLEAKKIAKELEDEYKKGSQQLTGATPDVAPAAPASRPPVPPVKKPPFPAPRSNIRYTWKGHKTAALAEEDLARTVHNLPDQAVVRWGDPIGAHGADVISVNIRTGEVTLWDSKFRGASTTIQPSPTFQNPSTLDNAISKARDAIREDVALPQNIRQTALRNLELKKVNTRTVGAGNAKNSTLE